MRALWDRAWVAAVAFLIVPTSVGAQIEMPDPVYRVKMSVSYEPEDHSLAGVERIRWRNNSSVPIDELQFHLYLNAFANDRSTFMAGSGGQLRGVEIPEEGWGWIEVESMRLAYGSDLIGEGVPGEGVDVATEEKVFAPLLPPFPESGQGDPQLTDLDARPDLKRVEEFIRPDDGNEEDRTVVRYPLPRPLGPGEWVELDIEFAARLPKVFARTGHHEEFVLGGQWFPKIGVFEAAGARGRTEPGWNTHQFHAHSEFFADFGDWDVELKLPARYAGKIGATGRLVSESVEGDHVTARFAQSGVHDFAWTASPDFEVVTDTFDPDVDVPPGQTARWAELLGVPPSELRLQPFEIRLMLQPAHRAQAERYLEATKVAAWGYGLPLGAYPWETMTLVDPPRGGMGAGGMEYPTFITLTTHPILNLPGLDEILVAEMVTVHEFGHNFFQGMIASNEFEESWIDEGINSFYEMKTMDEVYRYPVQLFGLRASAIEMNRATLRSGQYTDSIVQSSWSFRQGSSYGLNSYDRPAVTLHHLENLMGEEVFSRAMRRFFQTWRFRHPSTEDFKRIILEEAEEDLAWFLEQAFHTDRTLDYAVDRVQSMPVEDPYGWFWDEEGGKVLRGKEDEDGKDAVSEEVEAAEADSEDDEGPYRTEVWVQRRGEFVHPVTVEFRFEDGEVLRHEWDGQARWKRFEEVQPSRLSAVVIDPDNLLTLDVDRLNNSYRLESDRRTAAKMLSHLVFWLQNLFQLTAMAG